MNLNIGDVIKVNTNDDNIKVGTNLKLIGTRKNSVGGDMYIFTLNRKNAVTRYVYNIDTIDNNILMKINDDDYTNIVGLIFNDNKDYILWNKENKKAYDKIKKYWNK